MPGHFLAARAGGGHRVPRRQRPPRSQGGGGHRVSWAAAPTSFRGPRRGDVPGLYSSGLYIALSAPSRGRGRGSWRKPPWSCQSGDLRGLISLGCSLQSLYCARFCSLQVSVCVLTSNLLSLDAQDDGKGFVQYLPGPNPFPHPPRAQDTVAAQVRGEGSTMEAPIQ